MIDSMPASVKKLRSEHPATDYTDDTDEFFLTGLFLLPILSAVMISTRTFFYFAFTYRFFFNEESGPAKFENDVLTT